MATAPNNEQMLRQIQLALSEIEGICDEFFTEEPKRADDDTKFEPPSDYVKIAPRRALNADNPVNAEHEETREFLFQEEANITNDVREHFLKRMEAAASPLPAEGSSGDNSQDSIQHGGDFTAEDYEVISKSFVDKLNNDVTRTASSNGIMGAEWARCTGGIDEHSAELLQEFYEEYGVPNPTELLMLSQFLRIGMNTVKGFCNNLHIRMATARRAEDIVAEKMLLVKLQEAEALLKAQQSTRAHCEDVDEEGTEMD